MNAGPGILVGSLLLASAASALAQDVSASRRLWTRASDGARLSLDVAGLRAYLRAAPQESTQAPPLTLLLPASGGAFARFAVVESPILEQALAERFPQIRTYRGQGLDDPGATVRFDVTPRGFHAMILSAGGMVLIDPATPGDTRHYVLRTRRDADRREPFRCLTGGESDTVAPPFAPQALPYGDVLRTYRLALAADGEYTATVCQPQPPGIPCALAALVTGINRVTGVYERDLAVRFVLIADEPLIIYTDPATDPYTNGMPAVMREENQANLTAVIGTPNFDIGHVFGTAGGGIATIPGVCLAAHKARGATGIANPVGDPFYIDYVSHELGHQSGANHSFNGTTSFCGPSRNAATAWEPGSGSTIMSYSGLCAAEDVQFFSDAYFHAGSQVEISNNVQSGTGSSCGTLTPTGNTIPSVSAGPDVTIPSATPFTLTATGSDPDGDALTFAWEEMDLGAAGPPNTDNGNRPIFRTLAPGPSPARTFPRLQYILANDNTPPTTPVSESLPVTNRSMQFRATIRDNRSGGGGVASDLMLVQVAATAGPFKVTAPDTSVTWAEGTLQPVTWNVANTTAAPVGCSTVDIRLSTDGGASFPVLLATATSNDGAEVVTVPASPTSTARVRVECATAPFFDVSNANFTIAVPVELMELRIE